MSEIKHRFKMAEGLGTGTSPASSDRDPPPGDKGGGYSPPLSRISSFTVREKNPVHRFVSRWEGENCSPQIHLYHPCVNNTLNNDTFVNDISIDAPSTALPVKNYRHQNNSAFECVFVVRDSNLELQLDFPIDDREHLSVTLLTVVIADQESGYKSNSWESDPPGNSSLRGKPQSDLRGFHPPGSSFYKNKEACVSSYSSKFSPMDCTTSNSYTDD